MNLWAQKRFKRADINKSLVKHNLETNHNFNLKDSKMFVYICSITDIVLGIYKPNST